MLHAPTNETKTETTQSKSQLAPQPGRELHPHAFGAAGAYALRGAGSTAPVRSPGAQRYQIFAGMQATHGNQAVLRMIQSSPQVARMAALRPSQSVMLQRKCACGGSSDSVGECAECKAKREASLQRLTTNQIASPTASGVPPIVHDMLSSPGQQLDVNTRAFMEPRFGHDFSQVRVHTDAKAAESAREVNALAYTVGKDVVFGTGQYAPGTSEGRKLMAHELTHVVQQSRLDQSPQQRSIVGGPNDSAELEANTTASRIGTEQTADIITPLSAKTLQRQDDDNEQTADQFTLTSIPSASPVQAQLSAPDVQRLLRQNARGFSADTSGAVVFAPIDQSAITHNIDLAALCNAFGLGAQIRDNRADRSIPFLGGFIQNVLCFQARAEYEDRIIEKSITNPTLDVVTAGPQTAQIFASFFTPFYSNDAVAIFSPSSAAQQQVALFDCPGFQVPFCQHGAGLIRQSFAITLKTWLAVSPLINGLNVFDVRNYVLLQETNAFRIRFCVTFDPWAIRERDRLCNLELTCGGPACREGTDFSVRWGPARSKPVINNGPANFILPTVSMRAPVAPSPCPGGAAERTNRTILCFS